jgi:hypothetical protein
MYFYGKLYHFKSRFTRAERVNLSRRLAAFALEIANPCGIYTFPVCLLDFYDVAKIALFLPFVQKFDIFGFSSKFMPTNWKSRRFLSHFFGRHPPCFV